MNYNVEWCPNCGSHRVASEMSHDPLTLDATFRVRCQACGLEVYGFDTELEAIDYWNAHARKLRNEPEKENPYTDFAKEMSLLHEALKAEGFRDSMVDILVKMAPIIFDKTLNERARNAIKEAYLQQLDTEAMLRAVRKTDNPYATRRGELNVGGAGGCTEGDGIR